jgi:heat shock protein HslJ
VIRRRSAVPLLVGVLTLAGCATPSGPDDPGSTGGWIELPAPPLSPRTGAATAWTGSEALFLGGDTGSPCIDTGTGSGDCELPPGATDGAAFDPVAGTWRKTADAPSPIQGYQPGAVSGDTVYLATAEQLLAYDASDDAWTTHPLPPDAPEYGRLAVVADTVVLIASERREGEPSGHAYDPAAGVWSSLPDDPLGPTFDRVPTATPAGLVLTAHTLVPNPGAEEPSLVRAAVLEPASGRWTLLEDSQQLGGWHWAWTGRRMVDPSLGSADGGEENNWGREFPIGGVLDPATGTWGPLPNTPVLADNDGWGVEALGGPLSAVHGWVYDDRAESWALLPPPPGAPPTPGSPVWAGDRLLVLGGVDPARGSTVDALSEEAWMWTPGSTGSGESESRTDDLAGVWALRSGTSGGAQLRIPDQARATIEFGERQRVGGTSFCNGYGGTYRLDGDELVLEDVASTLVLCEGEVGAAESAYLAVLMDGGLDVAVDSVELVLTSSAGELRFVRLPPVPVDDLTGVRWVLASLRGPDGETPAVGDPAVLELGEGGTATLSTGCQTMTGTWTTSGDSVFIADHVYDPTGCPSEVADQDSFVTQALSGGFQVSVDGDVLTVTDVDNRGAPGLTLVYRATT